MKKLLLFAGVLLLFFVGCTKNENNVTEPTSIAVNQLSKITLDSTATLPTQFVSISQEINGTTGGLISFEEDALSTEGRVVHVYAQFEVAPNAFIGNQTITMTADIDNGHLYFYPHMNFSQTCFLDYGLSNMNLTNLGFNNSDKKAFFVYIDDSGAIEPIDNMGVTLNVRRGTLKVDAAKINHFSRYAFIK